jgi:hypothetical protein
MATGDLRRSGGMCSAALLALGLLMLFSIGCRSAVAHEPGARGTAALATLSGTVRAPEGSSSIDRRAVEVINIDTDERHRITTGDSGEFTIRLKPGKYRVEVRLREGESLIKQPGVMHVSRTEADTRADIVIESARVARPRYRMATPVDPALGSPIV